MKILSIGDLHGKDYWKTPILGYNPSTNTGSNTTIDDFDKVVFIGDYVDDFVVSSVIMKHNLHEIIELKKQYPEKVVLLFGNHDLQYMFGYQKHGCSGYRFEMAADFGDLFRSNKELFQCAYEQGNHLWVHAGVHIGWYKFRLQSVIKKEGLEDLTLTKQLNYLFERENDVLFDVGYMRGGRFDVGGPFWVDRRMVFEKPVKGYHQIVGHSRVDDIKTFGNDETSITFIDCLDKNPDVFYVLDLEI